MKQEREYRSMELQIEQREEGAEPSFFVEGHAATFEPYVLLSVDGVDYSERIEPTAFDDADMSDVVLRVDHEGRVYARSSAGTLSVWTDENGLAQRADLSRTQAARELYVRMIEGRFSPIHLGDVVADFFWERENQGELSKEIPENPLQTNQNMV